MEIPSSPPSWQEQLLLFSQITSLGNHFALNLKCDVGAVADSLFEFKDHWKAYNPNKKGYGRYGLSVTSLDGELSGLPDLTSLMEYNRQNGTEYTEMSFRKFTSVYKRCSEIHRFIEPFAEWMGRAHFLKFDIGGLFPFHRDSYGGESIVFRIFVPLFNHPPRDFVFFLGNERLVMEPGRAYFINTRMEHALFSLHPDSLHLVLNVDLNRQSVARIEQLLAYT